MLKTRKHISLLLVVAMVLSIFAVGAVSFSAASEGGFYIAGDVSGWQPTDGFKLEANGAAEGVEEYYIEHVSFAAGDKFKVAYSEDGSAFEDSDWYPDGVGNDIEVAEDGLYTVYFRPNGDGAEDWIGDSGIEHAGKLIYLAKEEEETPDQPGSGTGVTVDGVSYDAHVGDTIHYEYYVDMAGMPTADGGNTGKIDSVAGSVFFDSSKLKLVSDTSKDENDDYPGIAPNLKSGVVINLSDGEIIYTAMKASGYDFSSEKVLVKADFEVIADGTSEIINKLETLSSGTVAMVDLGPEGVVVTEAPKTRSAVSVDCPHTQPTEAEPTQAEPTQAEPTQAEPTTAEPTTAEPTTAEPTTAEPTTAEPTTPVTPGQSTVTVIGIDGSTTTKYVKVGDEIVVTNYLQVPEGKRVNSINFWQTFNDGDNMLQIVPKVTTTVDEDGQEDTVTEYIQTPRIGDPTANVEGNIIKVNATKAAYSQSYKFPNADSILSITTYKVIAEGNTKIKTDLITLATIASDDSMENQIMEGEKVGSDDIKTDDKVDGGSDTPDQDPTTAEPTSAEPTTSEPTTSEPTTAEPTTSEPTSAEPTAAEPTQGYTGVLIKADGVYYAAEKGEIIDYIYYLNTGEKVCSLDAETFYDVKGLELKLPTVFDEDEGEEVVDYAKIFPVLKDAPISNFQNGHLIYNYSAAAGKKFDTDDKQLIHLTFEVTAETGIYEINTMLHVVAGENEEKYIFDDEVIKPLQKSVGVLDGKDPYEGPVVEPTKPATGDEPTTVEPTTSQYSVLIKADGKYYAAEKGDIIEYVYYLNNGEKVCSLDAETFFDVAGLKLILPTVFDEDEGAEVINYADVFPVLKDAPISNFMPDEGHLIYNYSAAAGKKFDTDDKQLIHLTFEVTAESGIYEINTLLHVLAGENETKYIFDDEVLIPLKKAEGAILGKEPVPYDPSTPDQPTTATTPTTEPVTTPTTEPGTTPTTEPGTTPTTEPATTPSETPTQDATGSTEDATGSTAVPATAPTSSSSGGGSSSNSSTVKTGSTEMAVIFLMIVVMAAGVVLYTKKRKFD